jgi:hypothetical protein
MPQAPKKENIYSAGQGSWGKGHELAKNIMRTPYALTAVVKVML